MTEYTREEILDKDFDIKEFASNYGQKYEKTEGFPLEIVPGEGLYKRSSYLDAKRNTKRYLANMDEDTRIHTIGALANDQRQRNFFRYPLVLFVGIAIGMCAKGCGPSNDAAKAPTVKTQHNKP